MVERRSPKPDVVGSSPTAPVVHLGLGKSPGRIAQLGEHLPYKQGVTGSSPVAPIEFLTQ